MIDIDGWLGKQTRPVFPIFCASVTRSMVQLCPPGVSACIIQISEVPVPGHEQAASRLPVFVGDVLESAKSSLIPTCDKFFE
jgi:hypothetical protein